MRSDPAENADEGARPLGAGAFAHACQAVLARLGAPLLALTLVAGGLSACSREVDIAPPKAQQDTGSERSAGAQDALDALVRALDDRSREAAVALAAPGSADVLTQVEANAAALRVGSLSMRYVDDGGTLSAAQSADLGPDAWAGTVQVAYRFDGFDTTPARVDARVVFVPGSGRARIAAFGGGEARTPLWLEQRLSVARSGRTLVAVAGSSAGRYPGLARRAVTQVRRVLPRWRGPLLVEVPRTQGQLDGVLDAASGQYDNIAAVTTTADGSLERGAPVRVFINPAVFEDLKDRGAQVVMSHEATHVATGATFVSMPTWLLEGFADYVALDDAGVPVRVAAAQILARIRKEGVPDRLPTTEDLDPTASGLGATYEEAWLACRFLAQEYGADRLVRFYETVSDGTPALAAFARVLGTSQREFVTRWQADLRGLVRVAG